MSRRLDEVVVDRDDRVADRSRLGIGQQGLGSGDDRHLRSSIHGVVRCRLRRPPRGGRGEHQPGNVAGTLDRSPHGKARSCDVLVPSSRSLPSRSWEAPRSPPRPRSRSPRSRSVGGADEKPSVKFPKPFAATASTHRVVSAGTGDKLAKGNRILFDYLVVDGRTGAELGSSFGATPVATVLDAKQTAKGLVSGLVGASVGSRVLDRALPEGGTRGERPEQRCEEREEERHVALRRRREGRADAARARDGRGGHSGRRIAGGHARRHRQADDPVPTPRRPPSSSCNRSSPAPAPRSPRSDDHRALHRSSSTGAARTSPRRGPGRARRLHGRHRRRDPRVGPGPRRADGRLAGPARRAARPGLRRVGSSQAGIAGTDTLVFVVDILDAY